MDEYLTNTLDEAVEYIKAEKTKYRDTVILLVALMIMSVLPWMACRVLTMIIIGIIAISVFSLYVKCNTATIEKVEEGKYLVKF